MILKSFALNRTQPPASAVSQMSYNPAAANRDASATSSLAGTLGRLQVSMAIPQQLLLYCRLYDLFQNSGHKLYA